MTTKRLAELLRELTPTEFTDSVLLMWISNCENTILTDVLLASPEDCVELTELNDAKMLVPHPWDKLYLPYMQAQVAHANGEYDHYANYLALYNAYLEEYIRHILETVRPAGGEAVTHGYYLSAYAIAVEHGYKGTVEQWLKSLIGPQGDGGKDAYTIAVENGFAGTVEQWLEAMKGDAATVEIVGADALAPGAKPTVTEMAGSTAQYRLYKLGIPKGDKGANGDTGETRLPVARGSSADGIAYTATDAESGCVLPIVRAGSQGTHIGKGRQIVFVPYWKNESNMPTLKINDGDAIPIRLRAQINQGMDDDSPDATLPVPIGSLMVGVPYTLTFCGKYWLVDSMPYSGRVDITADYAAWTPEDGTAKTVANYAKTLADGSYRTGGATIGRYEIDVFTVVNGQQWRSIRDYTDEFCYYSVFCGETISIYVDSETGDVQVGSRTMLTNDNIPLPTAADIGKVLTATAANRAVWMSVVNAEEVAV